jgi:DNA-binding response OmpR family regulator
MGKYILVIDDDPLFTVSTAFSLQTAGYETATAASAEEALTLIGQRLPDIILLDIGLPGMDGLEALRLIRQQIAVPIIFVTARRRELDEVVGLELGADDFITKPFGKDVLLARIKAVLRRANPPIAAPARAVTVGDIFIDPNSHTVQVGERLIDMSRKEFDLLLVLALDAGHVMSVAELIKRVWGDAWVGEMQTIYVHIRWLREKIEVDPGHPRRLITVKGVGYKLLPQADD